MVLTGAAHAQRIDRYLYSGIRGFGEQPGVTVVSRLRPDYDYPGVDLGDFILHPELTESVGYDDNVNGSSTSRGSSVVDTQGIVKLASRWLGDSLQAGLSVDDDRYLDQPRQSSTNWTANLSGTHDFGQDQLYAGFSHINLNQTARNLDAPQLDKPIAFRIDDGRADYRAVFGALSVQPGIEVAGYEFDNGTVLGVPYLESYRDRMTVTPSLRTEYEFAPLRSAVLLLSDTDATYSHQLAGQPPLDFNDFSVLAGLNYDTGGPVRLRLLAGYERRTFTSVQFQTIAAPVIEASAVWTPTGLTTVTATASRYIQDSASEVTAGYTEAVLKLAVDHELLRNVLLNASGTYITDSYDTGQSTASTAPQSSSAESYYTIQAGATWLLNRHARLVLRYQFAHRDSVSSAVLGPSVSGVLLTGGAYSENRITLQVRIGL